MSKNQKIETMKSLAITIMLLFSGNLSAQCVKLYVQEHLTGSPICNLSEGDYIEICEDANEVNGCPRNFYVYDKGSSYGNLTYELSLDRGWSTHYMTLMVNPKTKRFGFILQGQTAMYSYITETEMAQTRKLQAEQQRIEYEIRVQQARIEDERVKVEINSALEQKEYFKALQFHAVLNYKDNDLLLKINEGWLPEKERYDKMYQNFLSEFNQIKKEYYTSEKEFYTKYSENIKSEMISINGKEAILKQIANTYNTNRKEISRREYWLKYDGYAYTKIDNKHLICPVGIDGIYYTGRYNEQVVDKLNIALLYDTSANTYVPVIDFYKDEEFLLRKPIVNRHTFQTNYFLMPYPMEIFDLYKKIRNQSGRNMLDSLYPQQILYLDSNEPIVMSGLTLIDYPDEGKKNDIYDALKNEFESMNNNIEEYMGEKIRLTTDNFYNPSILYLVKKIYPKADSIVFAFGNFKKPFGNLGLHIDFESKLANSAAKEGSFIPLIKGVIELKKDKFFIYDKKGNYQEVSAKLIVPESKLALTNINIDSLKLDSTFLKQGDAIAYVAQYPIFYEQSKLEFNQNYCSYLKSEDLNIQLLPLYDTKDIELCNGARTIIDPIYNLCLNFNTEPERNGITYDRIAKKYFEEMTNYFEYKRKSKSKKAESSLNKANHFIDLFKQVYFDPKYGTAE